MYRIILLFTLAFTSWSLYAYDQSNEWLQKSHGEFKVSVYRVLGEAHAQDYVELQIFRVKDDGSRELDKKVELPTPGLKGYVRDILFNSLENGRMVINFQIEMLAMDGVVLSEVFIVENTGKFERVIEAKYVDLYKDM